MHLGDAIQLLHTKRLIVNHNTLASFAINTIQLEVNTNALRIDHRATNITIAM